MLQVVNIGVHDTLQIEKVEVQKTETFFVLSFCQGDGRTNRLDLIMNAAQVSRLAFEASNV